MRIGDMWAGASRREENHQKWEDNNPKEAIRAKARHAQFLAISRDRPRKPTGPRQRNNFREY